MRSRRWWAIWLSGFFGIAGLMHVLRFILKIQLSVGMREIPLAVSLIVGLVFLMFSAILLWIVARQDKARYGCKRG